MKSKTLRIIVDSILIILGIIFLVFGIKDAIGYTKTNNIEDNVKFSKSYTNVLTDNKFKYIKSLDEIENKKNIIVFFFNPEDPWSQVLATTLYQITKDKLDVIYYLESQKDDDIPKLIILNDKEEIYTKSDLVDSEYDGIPVEYWTDVKKNELSKLIFNN